MSPTSRGYPAGDLRASDADRDAALAELSEHFQAGRLTNAEFDERSSLALSAQTGAQLTSLMADLPDTGASAAVPAPSAAARQARRGAVVTAAIVLAVVGLVAAGAAFHGHRGSLFPWWLIPIGLIMMRRLARGARHSGSG